MNLLVYKNEWKSNDRDVHRPVLHLDCRGSGPGVLGVVPGLVKCLLTGRRWHTQSCLSLLCKVLHVFFFFIYRAMFCFNPSEPQTGCGFFCKCVEQLRILCSCFLWRFFLISGRCVCFPRSCSASFRPSAPPTARPPQKEIKGVIYFLLGIDFLRTIIKLKYNCCCTVCG